MKKVTLSLVVLCALSILSAQSRGSKKISSANKPIAPEEESISLSGAFALYPLAVKWSEEYKKLHPNIRFDIQAGGAGKGMTDALNGAVTLGMFSKAISAEEKKRGVWFVAVTKDAVLPTMNAKNPNLAIIKKQGIKKEVFKKIFIDNTITSWADALQVKTDVKMQVYTRSDASGAADSWAAFLGGKQENLKGIGIFGDPGIANEVAKNTGAIGYNNTIYAYDPQTGKKRPGIEIIPIDINGDGKITSDEDFYSSLSSVMKAIGQGKYPEPPARELYFVSKGKPLNKTTLNFLKWVLKDGQKYVSEAGFVPLTSKRIKEETSKL